MDVEALARESHVNPFRTGCKASLQVGNFFMDNVGGWGSIAAMEMSAGLSVSSSRNQTGFPQHRVFQIGILINSQYLHSICSVSTFVDED